MGRRLFEYRLAVLVALFAIALCAVAIPVDAPLMWRLTRPGGTAVEPLGHAVSAAVLLVAFLFRLFGEGRLRAVVYGQGATDALVTSGVFARTRNPLYWGTLLFLVGASLVWAPLLVTAALGVVMFVFLDVIVRHEEGLLAERYGERFAAYVEKVPRWGLWGRGGRGEDADVKPAYTYALMGNLGILSLGLYRVAVAAVGPDPLLGLLNLVCMGIWLVVVIVRRVKARHAQ